MPPTPKSENPSIFTGAGERRSWSRNNSDQVPWIKEVKPAPSAESARLLNISRSGVLLETTVRLRPGRRSTIVIVNDVDQRERVEGRVVRTELVGTGRNGEFIYRSAMAFTRELDLRLPGVAVSADHQMPSSSDGCVQSQLEGPLPALWATAGGSRRVEVSYLTSTGCFVASSGAALTESAVVTVFFSSDTSLTLRGRVAAVEPERGCLLRFEELTARTRSVLRAAILHGIARGQSAPPQPVAVGTLLDAPNSEELFVEWRPRPGTLHATQW
jgi:hypothetical protein